MHKIKDPFKSFFSFSKKELNAIFLLFSLIMIVLVTPWFYKKTIKSAQYDFKKFQLESASFKKAIEIDSPIEEPEKTLKIEYFDFDPNLITERQWVKLGLSAKQIRVIRNYIDKGGRFYKKEDLKRIYSIPETQYLKLEPFIVITNTRSSFNPNEFKKGSEVMKTSSQMPAMKVEINGADSISLLKISGIGPSFASRIIRFRNRLGGFHSIEQLREVYGIDSIKYSQIKDQLLLDLSLIQKINVNNATFDQLKKQPYLSYKQINAILQYRKQHGDFKSLSDLRKIIVLNEEIIRKIEPYIAF